MSTEKFIDAPMVYGYIPSTIDGTELIFDIDKKIELPDEFSWVDVLPPIKNQGNTQTCVAQSLTCTLDFIKNCEDDTPGEANGFSVSELYNMRSNKPLEGMSIKEALLILKDKGLNGMRINSFAMIPSVEACKQAILMFGPICAGLPVYSTNTLFWKKTGLFLGGHAVEFVGFCDTGFILRNSWGKSYGKNGYSIFPYKDFEKCVFEAWTATI